jgi:hypothetical protein
VCDAKQAAQQWVFGTSGRFHVSSGMLSVGASGAL